MADLNQEDNSQPPGLLNDGFTARTGTITEPRFVRSFSQPSGNSLDYIHRNTVKKMQKFYRRSSIPKDEARIHSLLPTIRDAASKLYELCTCTPKIRGQVRPATESDEEFFTCLGDLFRCYRWLAANADHYDFKSKETYVKTTLMRLRQGVDVIERIVPLIDPSLADPWIKVTVRDSMACGVQVIANCVRQDPEIQNVVWSEFFEVIGSLIILEEDKLLNYISAAIVNCATEQRIEQIVDRGYAARIFERISVFGAREDSMVAFEAVFDLAGYLLQCPLVAQRDFDLLPLSAKCAILDLLSSMFTLNGRGTSPCIPQFWPEKIAHEFITSSRCLMRLKDISTQADEECELVLKTLDMLGNVTSSEESRKAFVDSAALLDCTIDAFIEVDTAGKAAPNQFSPVEKLADVKPQDLITPARGLKSRLLRLLANLVYNNPDLEKRAAERNLLQHLKENARIDYRNPYIQQWAILAIRNLQFSAAFDELRKEHDRQDASPVPGVAHSLDGDGIAMSYERKHSEGLGIHRYRPIHSETVEALDLHISHSESGLYDHRHRRPVRKAGHHLRVGKKHSSSKKPLKTDQETQTMEWYGNSTSVSSDCSVADRFVSDSPSTVIGIPDENAGFDQTDLVRSLSKTQINEERINRWQTDQMEQERRPRHQSH
ncbi:uncharacterized protein LOC129599238 [Paramacrobiotus metropolitanus]|uniref:uncharacterized protein LOC129599238 n=1 Tax=Paramacrobiotus metropolitanus TaxID=2943436 RepID=UPI002445FB72|nr:uncharacterized protein LOC129599238 [Paramacrobiotus metropolitanus]